MSKTSTRYRRTSRASQPYRVRTQQINITKPYQQSLTNILIDKCDKCTQQLQKGNMKLAKQFICSIDKDLELLNSSHKDYARLMSLVYNIKAGYYRRNSENQEALKYIDLAIVVEKQGNIDRIDMARTLLNKSVIMGQMARDDKSQYSHENAIALAKQALQIIKSRPQGKQFVHKDQYKLGQIIIISFHNIATQLVCLKNEKQGYNLYKKAHDLALRVLGPRHNLTIHLKNIISKYKQQKNEKKRLFTQQTSPQKKVIAMNHSQVRKNSRKNNFIEQNKKFRSFFQIYGYDKQKSQKSKDINKLQMTDLGKIQKLYKPVQPTSYFPQIKQRKNAKDILIKTDNQRGKELSTKRLYASSANNEKQMLKSMQKSKQLKDNSVKKQIKKETLDKLKTESIVLRPQPPIKTQKPIIQQNKNDFSIRKEVEQNKKQQKQKLEEGGCQLI